jgi:hypothetical protein
MYFCGRRPALLDMGTRTLVRIPCRSHGDVKELALRLEADGYSVARRRRAVIARTETRERGEELARKLQAGAVVLNRRRSRLRPLGAFALVAGLRRI